ncbi:MULTISPECIES: regulatory protein RecX [unclassified Coleofasciculus]|uniref:regulatory protein RecX n=1 Tax=unclassified Coleofasciculus TaxID=2692782 RepID=UPI001881124F|nr:MULTISPECIES: regulatory protein RecX [unclassified Coleofasciculus]MBE9130176.1 regulatory protein RecX [Coleofasciculus sp. LEGE 07081]MBE9151862.1 regulatory protein RecX [Coleofasciculus sp. LEGE 07092]
MTCIDYFYKLLARREYSAFELTRKAREKGFDSKEIAETIQELQYKDYQSDTRFVESMITSYHGKYGKSFIKRKCWEKGIAADLFEELWELQNEGEETGELGSLKAKVIRKYKINDFYVIDPKTKAKLWNYLQYRGFKASEVLEKWQREQEEAME